MKYIIYVLLIGLIIPGGIGCDDNNGGGQGDGSMPPEALTGCMPLSSNPCTFLNNESDGAYYSCIVGDAQTCAVDLMSIIDAISASFTTVTGDTTMWIEVWGGNGGSTDKGKVGGTGGYAITTTTVNDIAGINNGSTVIYYFLGSNGGNGGDHCGSAGGSSTMVTLEDLTLNPSSDPTQTSPPILLVAGGAGGGCGGNGSFGCTGPGCNGPGYNGGIAIASLNTIGSGPGEDFVDPPPTGGDMGMGGSSSNSGGGGGNETSGMNGYGGLGGAGGSGQSCTGPGTTGFRSAPEVDFSDGQGGKGSSNTSDCDSGGGGGGGGWGGGGGGGHGNDEGRAYQGGGGGSFAIQSTVSSDLSPTSEQSNPCGTGCLRISFAP